MKRQYIFIALVLVLLVACGPAGPATPTTLPTVVSGALSVDPKTELGPISPYLYGSNYGPWTAVPVDMLQYAFDSRITVLRWPGGAWGDQNDIQSYQLDSFMDFCKKVGAIPTISVRLLNGTPEAAAELVRYANIEKGYKIVYWSIGNEPTLYESQIKQTYDTVRFNREWRAIALAMKAVDPNIKLMGPELHQWGTNLPATLKDSSGRDWMTEFLKVNGDLVDVVTVHRYPMYHVDGTPSTVDELRQNTLEWGDMVVYLRALIHDTTGRDIPIAFTEVNSDPSNVIQGVASPDSFYNAIWYADVLGRLMSEHVLMVNNFVLASRQGGLGMIYNSEIRPTYFVFQMYHQFGNEQVFASSGAKDVTIYAAKRTDGTLTVMVINLGDSSQRVPLKITGVKLSTADVWLLDASHSAEDLGQQSFPSDGILELPAQSITLYVIAK
jgi:hypothetical protein